MHVVAISVTCCCVAIESWTKVPFTDCMQNELNGLCTASCLATGAKVMWRSGFLPICVVIFEVKLLTHSAFLESS